MLETILAALDEFDREELRTRLLYDDISPLEILSKADVPKLSIYLSYEEARRIAKEIPMPHSPREGGLYYVYLAHMKAKGEKFELDPDKLHYKHRWELQRYLIGEFGFDRYTAMYISMLYDLLPFNPAESLLYVLTYVAIIHRLASDFKDALRLTPIKHLSAHRPVKLLMGIRKRMQFPPRYPQNKPGAVITSFLQRYPRYKFLALIILKNTDADPRREMVIKDRKAAKILEDIASGYYHCLWFRIKEKIAGEFGIYPENLENFMLSDDPLASIGELLKALITGEFSEELKEKLGIRPPEMHFKYRLLLAAKLKEMFDEDRLLFAIDSSFMLLIFDFGGTLIRLRKPEDEIFEEIFEELSERRGIEKHEIKRSYNEVFGPYERRRNEHHIEVFSRTLWRSFIRRIVDASEDDIRKAHALVVKKYQEYSEPYEDSLETLKELKARGYKIALLSNATYHDAVIGALDYHNLLEFIDFPYTSASIGIRKPHPRAFILAAKLSGFEPSNAVMIGNDPYKDFMGAINAGLKAILVDREGKIKGKNVVRSLRELLEIL